MNLCECARIMDRISQALTQLVNSMIGANNSNTQSLTDSGELLSNTPNSNNSNGQQEGTNIGMMFLTIVFLIIFSLFLRAVQRNNNNNTENNNNNEPNKLFVSRKI